MNPPSTLIKKLNTFFAGRIVPFVGIGCLMIGFKIFEFNNIIEEIQLMKKRYDENVRSLKRYRDHESSLLKRMLIMMNND